MSWKKSYLPIFLLAGCGIESSERDPKEIVGGDEYFSSIPASSTEVHALETGWQTQREFLTFVARKDDVGKFIKDNSKGLYKSREIRRFDIKTNWWTPNNISIAGSSFRNGSCKWFDVYTKEMGDHVRVWAVGEEGC